MGLILRLLHNPMAPMNLQLDVDPPGHRSAEDNLHLCPRAFRGHYRLCFTFAEPRSWNNLRPALPRLDVELTEFRRLMKTRFVPTA